MLTNGMVAELIFSDINQLYQRYAEHHQQKNQKQPPKAKPQETHTKKHIPFSNPPCPTLFLPAEARNKCRYPLHKQPTADKFSNTLSAKTAVPDSAIRCPIEMPPNANRAGTPPAVHGKSDRIRVQQRPQLKNIPSPSVLGDFF